MEILALMIAQSVQIEMLIAKINVPIILNIMSVSQTVLSLTEMILTTVLKMITAEKSVQQNANTYGKV